MHSSPPFSLEEESELIGYILSGLSIFRWNSFPRIRTITTLDHLGFVAHIVLILALARKEKEGKEYDMNLLLKKVLFSGFFTFFYSDINAEMKDLIKKNHPDIYKKLGKNSLERLSSLAVNEAMQQDLDDIAQATEEDVLIRFAKVWASYKEVEQNSIVYPHAYTRLLENLRRQGTSEEFSPFLKYLSFDSSDTSSLHDALLVIHRLASSFRWNRSMKKYPISVLSHTFLITFFTYMLTKEQIFGKDEETDMYMTALLHDIPEAITGDIITPTKKSIPGLEEAIESAEKELVHAHLLSYISQYKFSEMYGQKMLQPWSEEHGKIVKQADILSALHEARIEDTATDYFRNASETMKKRLKEYKNGLY